MKQFLFSFAIGVGVSMAGCSPSTSAAVTVAALESDVRFLSSDGLKGRRAGEPGADAAADWIAQRLRDLGVQPGGQDGTWFQELKVDLPPRPGECQLHLTGKSVADVSTVAASSSGFVAGESVSAGYGLVLPSHGLNDFAEAQVSGKIVLIRRGTPFGPNAAPELASLGALRGKIRSAVEAGAIGVILGTHPDDVAKGFESEIRFSAVPGRMNVPVVTVSPRQFLVVEERIGEVVEIEVSVIKESAKTRNVIGWLPGTADPGSGILVGAHYDHLGMGGAGSLAPGSHEVHNGADDNASGVAVLLAAAGDLAASSEQLEKSVVFAFWAAEEEGLLGSAHWAKNSVPARVQVIAGINLDMVGRPLGGRLTAGSLETSSGLGFTLAKAESQVDAQMAIADLSIGKSKGRLPGGGGSDHMSLHAVEIPCAFLFSGLHADYHKPTDDWEHLDYPRMAVLVELVVAWVVELTRVPVQSLAYIPPPPEPSRGPVRGAGAWFGSIPDYGAEPVGGGMQLAGVSPGGPAAVAGLRKGDVLKRMKDMPIADIYDFMDALGEAKPGERVLVQLLRDGEPMEIEVVLGTRTAD